LNHILETTEAAAVRLDKWLWAARFFKTRNLATEAISGGKVHVNGERSRPGKRVRIGDELHITRGQEHFIVTILKPGNIRRGAAEAALLYEETAQSQERRQQLRQHRSVSRIAPASRPEKQDRRKLARLKRLQP